MYREFVVRARSFQPRLVCIRYRQLQPIPRSCLVLSSAPYFGPPCRGLGPARSDPLTLVPRSEPGSFELLPAKEPSHSPAPAPALSLSPSPARSLFRPS